MGWFSSSSGSVNHWIATPSNVGWSVGGMQRDHAIQPTLNGTLAYEMDADTTFKSTKMYQYEVKVEGNFASVGFSASYAWTDNSVTGGPITGGETRIDRIDRRNTALDGGGRYYFYSSPYSDTISYASGFSTAAIFLLATGSLSGSGTASPRIDSMKVTEMDWLVSGYRRYSPGLTQSIGDMSLSDIVNYNGWLFEESANNIFWWTNKPTPTMGATGLSTNGDLTTNYISKAVPYPYYNLSFEYLTDGGTYSDGFSIYQGNSGDGSSLGVLLYTLTQSQFSTQSTAHEIFGLQGNGTSIFFVGSVTSNVNGFVGAIINPIVSGGYHPSNNQQFLFTNSGTYSDPTILQILGTATSGMTFSFIVGSGSTITGTPSNLNVLDTLFGNGTFRSGVWENGVWNSGWRVDTQIYEFDDISAAFRTISDKRWRVQLTGPASSGTKFNIGDRISISNIVAIDINETRKLLKGFFTIVDKSDTDLIVETDVSFPFRRFEKDSSNHKIRVTKNIWLSGAFLNGYYTGIWNYGLFKGFPRITEMFDTHWIDGIFDGGHFNSSHDTYLFADTYYISAASFGLKTVFEGKLGLSFSTPHGYVVGDIIDINKDNKSENPGYDGNANVIAVIDNYLIVTDKIFGASSVLESGTSSNTKANGLIQNFTFHDNNIATKVSSQSPSLSAPVFQFNSWIDVNYYDTSAVNIGKPTRLYDTTNRVEYTQNNLYGYPTNDVLASVSSFRDSYSFNIRDYKLGTKYKIYQDQIGNASEFNRPFNMSDIGLETFIEDGWTFSGTGSIYERSGENSQWNTSVSEERAIKGEELVITSTMSGSILNNINVVIEKNRYTIAEFDIKTFSTATSSLWSSSDIQSIGHNTPIPVLNFNNINRFFQSYIDKQTHAPKIYYQDMNYIPVIPLVETRYGSVNINHLSTPALTKFEYFFNKPTLSMMLLGSDDVDPINTSPITLDGYYQSKITMDNLKYYEVDMIPFFQYFVDGNISKGVSVPWQGISPFIDYSISNFSFIDSISIGLGSVQTVQSFTPVSGVGIGISGFSTSGGGHSPYIPVIPPPSSG